MVILIAFITAGILYFHSYLTPEEEIFLAMDFIIDVNTDNGAFLRFITPDGKEKIEVFEGRFADGTKIFESRSYKHYPGWWKEYSMNQEEQTVDKVRSVGGNQFYHLLEIMNPAIRNLVYEYQAGEKGQLKIVEINGRRFTFFYRQPWNKEYYEIYGLNGKDETLWEIASYYNKVTMQHNSRENYALTLVLEKHPEFPFEPDGIKEISVRTGGKYPGMLVDAKLTSRKRVYCLYRVSTKGAMNSPRYRAGI